MHKKISAGRREFLKSAVLAAAAASNAALWATPAGAVTEGEMFPIGTTRQGKVRGYNNRGVLAFKGLPYGASTGGKNRFMPPKPPANWSGIRDAWEFGHIAPQVPSDPLSEYGRLILWDQQPGGMSEDCLTLNVFTPALDEKKRAVLVSFHGGGYTTGSGNHFGFDGDSLARFGDVVVVTVNHRLGILGYLNLASLGGPAESGVAGIADLVASLRWVRDNIAQFGGDPGNVTIFGQSGGGAKTSVVLAVPSAKGLFHRAMVQSGSQLRAQTPEAATESAEKLLQELGVAKGNLAALQAVPVTRILAAQATLERASPPVSFSPAVDGKFLPHHPFDPRAPEESADVPLIVSTTLDDAALRLTNFDLTEAGLKGIVDKLAPGKSETLLKLYRRDYPQATPFLIQARMLTDRGRVNAMTQAERKSAQGRAPVYMYLFDWLSPTNDGKFGAVHGTDVSLTFHDWRGPIAGSGSVAGKAIADRVASAVVAFAKTGNPNSPALPHWPAYDAKTRATMVFDVETRVENDPRGEFLEAWQVKTG